MKFVIKTMDFVYVNQHMAILIQLASVKNVTIVMRDILDFLIANVGISELQ